MSDSKRQTSCTSNLGRFGSAAEFNAVGAGQLVRADQPGLRPTFRIVAGAPPVPWSHFIASPFPSLTWLNGYSCEWHTQPRRGGVVCVPGDVSANVVLSFPKLVAAPVPLQPELFANISVAAWRRIGLDPDCQTPLWRFPDGQLAEIRPAMSGYEYEYYTNANGRRWARVKQTLPIDFSMHTEGQAVEPGQDFVQLRGRFGLLVLDDFPLPAGTYHFQAELQIIPRSAAYRWDPSMPLEEYYRNQYLSQLPDLPTTTIDIIGDVPLDLVLPTVTKMHPVRSRPGERVIFEGTRLDRTRNVMFSPGVAGALQILSDSLIEAIVPDQAQSGLVVVETTLGWVKVQPHLVVDAVRFSSGGDLAW